MVIKKVTQLIRSLLFPTACIYCGETPYLICDSCFKRLRFRVFQECPICRVISADCSPCTQCRSKTDLDSLEYVFTYGDEAKQLIKQLKYSRFFAHSDYIAKILVKWFKFKKYKFSKSDLWTFAPSSKASIQKRGFNQVEEILKSLKKQNKIRYSAMFTKQKNTKRQALLTRSERLTNIKGRIAFKKGFKIPRTIKKILILDDVATTGSTLSECCRILKAQYGKQIKIYCITLARPKQATPTDQLPSLT
jgi:competence protein ComFC